MDDGSLLFTKFTYPLMGSTSFFWLIMAMRDWIKFPAISTLFRMIFVLAFTTQINVVYVIIGIPWVTETYGINAAIWARWGWGIVAVTWFVHTVIVVQRWIRLQRL